MPLKLNLLASQAFGGYKFSFTCSDSGWDTVEKQPLKAQTLAAKPPGTPLPAQLPIGLVFSQVSAMGMLRTKGSTWSAYLHVNFQNVSPTFHPAIVMLLYLSGLGTNRREGPKVGQNSVLALLWLRLCPTGWEPDCYFSLALSSHAEPGGLFSLLGFGGSRHLTMGMLLPWITGLTQVTLVRV